MFAELTIFSSITSLVDMGGIPIAAILLLSLVNFVLFFERVYFFLFSFRQILPKLGTQADSLSRLGQSEKQWMQDSLISEAYALLRQHFWLLKAAIIACPLIGLMGTVSGMILVFDQISLSGTGNPRLMASGIFHATLPTMAGMAVSIIGLVMQYILQRFNLRSQTLLSQYLPSYQALDEQHTEKRNQEPKQ